MRVLIVEDEPKMAGLIRRGLREEGYAADIAQRGEEALWMAGATDYDAIVLDVLLPGSNGFEICRELRRSGIWSPVLMLTARDSVDEGVPDPRSFHAASGSGAVAAPPARALLGLRLREPVERG
jgi:two-component system, OmpR family, response regulator